MIVLRRLSKRAGVCGLSVGEGRGMFIFREYTLEIVHCQVDRVPSLAAAGVASGKGQIYLWQEFNLIRKLRNFPLGKPSRLRTYQNKRSTEWAILERRNC